MTDFSGDEVEVDLLGDEIKPIRDPRGRKSYKRTKENQRLVITLRGAGWTQDDIAAYLGCDPKTLRKHFSRELDNGRAFLEGMAMQVLVQKMLEGHVGAAKHVLEQTKGRVPTGAKPDAGKSKPIGRKEQLMREADAPPSSWGDLGITDGSKLN